MKNLQDLLSGLRIFIKKNYGFIDLVYLFGSYAKENNKANSDIDLAILLPESNCAVNPFFGLELEIKVKDVFGIECDVVILNNANYSLKYEALRTGIIVFEKNPVSRKMFELYSAKEYFDNLYYQQLRMQKSVKYG